MLFNSSIYILVFLPLSFFIYFYLNKIRLTEASKAFLVFSSLFFYSWWNVLYLPIILTSMLFNYTLGYYLSEKAQHIKIGKKSLLIFGISTNIALLVYFKYTDFFIENINYLTGSHMELLNLALPLAISFFTFQQIAYLVDSYRNEMQEHDFLNYALFVTFFPQLIAGPIVHHAEMMPQFKLTKKKVINYRNIIVGIFIFSIGLFKKVVIADTFAIWATQGFDIATTLNTAEAWIASLSYTFQLYFDFSGYADMAIGSALLFNIKLPINFNSPHKAVNLQDYWNRWHITLSRFLGRYIYIPLGGNRRGELRTYVNLFITLFIGGMWHGAGWTFLFWGFLHGIGLVTQKIWNKLGINMGIILAWLITFNFINITRVFFRARDWDDAIRVLKAMFSFNIVFPASLENKLSFLSQYGITFGKYLDHINGNAYTVIWILAAFILILMFKNSTERIEINTYVPTYRMAVFTAILTIISISMMMKAPSTEFLYFNF